MKKLILFSIVFLFIGKLFAQTCIKGQVKDKESEEALEFALVKVYLNGENLGGQITDLEGNYQFCNIPAGNYEIVVSYAGRTTSFENIQIFKNKVSTQHLVIEYHFSGCILGQDLMIKKDDVTTKSVFSKEFLRNQR